MECLTCGNLLSGKQTKFCSRKCINEVANNKNQTYQAQKERGMERKLYLIKQSGSCCQICGYNKNIAALEFHHLNPNEKENKLDARKLANSSLEWIENEFKKCVLLCSNCHRETHNPGLNLSEALLNYKGDEVVTSKKERAKKVAYCMDCNKVLAFNKAVRCESCNYTNKRLVTRPSKETLLQDVKEHGYLATGRKYGVSDNAIRKWIK